MIRVRHQLTGDKLELDKKLSALRNIKDANARVGNYLLTKTKENFDAERDPDGDRWRPLAPQTVEEKIRKGTLLKILQRTGALRAGFETRVNRASVRIYNTDPKFEYHQFGTDKVPQRRMIGLSERDRQVVVGIYQEHLEKNS